LTTEKNKCEALQICAFGR